MPCTTRIDVEETKIDGELTIGSQYLHTPAFAVVDVTSLWLPPTYRGKDLLVPGTDGQTPLPRRRDLTTRSLPMVLDGRVDWDGTPYTNERMGIRTNLMRIRTGTGEPNAVAATLTAPGGLGAVRNAVCRVINVELGERIGSLWAVMLDLEFPDGGFW